MAKWCAVVLLTVLAGALVAGEELAGRGARIVSGWPAQEGQFPYMMYLRGVNVHGHISSCGGSIIHQNWGMTSARCTAGRLNLMIRAGMVNINNPRVYIETNTYFTAPEYIDELQPISQPHDISVVRFPQAITFNSFVQPIRLMRSADMNKNYAGVRMTTAGWGTTWGNNWEVVDGSETLNWVHLVGVTNFMCLLIMNNSFLVRDSTICAGPYNVTTQSICSGDSGVPLTVVDNDGRLTQVGVGSFVSGFGCQAGLPNGFVRPGHYHTWLRQVTGINFDWTFSAAENVKSSHTDAETPLKILELPNNVFV